MSIHDKKKSLLILINEYSGVKKAGTNLMQLIRKAAESGYEPIVYPIVPGADLKSETLLPLYDGEIDMVLCSGGDGTLSHVVNAVMRMKNRPTVAYLPSGSTNDFAKGMGIPLTKPKAIETAFGGHAYSYDIGCLNGRYFNYVAAFGVFSDVSYETSQSMKNLLGYFAYVITAAGKLFQNKKYNHFIRIETDTGEIEGDILFGAVCNTPKVGGLNLFGKTDVKTDDGKMELLLVYDSKNLVELQAIASELLKGSSDHPKISVRQVEKAKFISEEPISWSLDGEFGGETQEAEIDVHHRAVTIMRR